jgi:hypothetical protein
MPMRRIRVLNGHAESEIWIERLRDAGSDVDARKVRAPDDLKALGRLVPAAVAIDLARAPAHGRDLGLAVRQMEATRQVPLVFVDGNPQQVERLRGLLPGAVYSSGRRIRSAVQRAIARPPQNPARPASVLAGYSGTPVTEEAGDQVGGDRASGRCPARLRSDLGSPAGGGHATPTR